MSSNLLFNGISLLDEPIDPESNIMSNFQEFCEDLDIMRSYINTDFYLEDVKLDPNKKGVKRRVGDVVNTATAPLKDGAQVYGNVTDAGGEVIRKTYDASFSIINLATKIIRWILKYLAKIPAFIAKVFKSIARIPDAIIDKIRGDISLYVTAEDLPLFYQRIFPQIDTFIMASKEMASGFSWSNMKLKDPSRRNANADVGYHLIKPNNYKKMELAHRSISKIKVEKRTINMRDKDTVKTYFGNKQSISFPDVEGQVRNYNYLGALIALTQNMQSWNEPLEEVRRMLADKFNSAGGRESFTKLSKGEMEDVHESMQMVAEVIRIVGDFIKYIIKDTNTIKGNVEKIKRKMGQATVEEIEDANLIISGDYITQKVVDQPPQGDTYPVNKLPWRFPKTYVKHINNIIDKIKKDHKDVDLNSLKVSYDKNSVRLYFGRTGTNTQEVIIIDRNKYRELHKESVDEEEAY